MRSSVKGFTLIELLIVVSILGIMAMIVVPHYVGASNSSRGAVLADQLRIIREQVNVYRAQHMGQWPGVDGNGAASADVNLFGIQLTAYTDRKGVTHSSKTDTFSYGPYLPSLPANPISGLKTFKLDAGSATPTPDDSTGWIYQTSTGKVWPNNTNTDSDGKVYFEY